MATLTIDTYAFIQTLKKAGISEPQAKAIADGLQQLDLAYVATKEDVRELRLEVKGDIHQLRADLFKWIVPLLLGQVALFAALVTWLR